MRVCVCVYYTDQGIISIIITISASLPVSVGIMRVLLDSQTDARRLVCGNVDVLQLNISYLHPQHSQTRAGLGSADASIMLTLKLAKL